VKTQEGIATLAVGSGDWLGLLAQVPQQHALTVRDVAAISMLVFIGGVAFIIFVLWLLGF
jgi:hypothetical protein